MSKWRYNGNVVLANLDSESIVNLQNLLKDIGDSAYNQGLKMARLVMMNPKSTVGTT